ncbi:MAG: DUF1127 domain-containing protein [Paracoccaceae bacterium]
MLKEQPQAGFSGFGADLGSPSQTIAPFPRRRAIRNPAVHAAILRAGAKIARIVAALVRRRRLRRAYADILKLDERMLRDIGVTRAEVRGRVARLDSAKLGDEPPSIAAQHLCGRSPAHRA